MRVCMYVGEWVEGGGGVERKCNICLLSIWCDLLYSPVPRAVTAGAVFFLEFTLLVLLQVGGHLEGSAGPPRC